MFSRNASVHVNLRINFAMELNATQRLELAAVLWNSTTEAGPRSGSYGVTRFFGIIILV
jgi:hypothetical protein